MMLHIGRKVPEGFRELPGGIHLGKGLWLLKMEPLKEDEPNPAQKKHRHRYNLHTLCYPDSGLAIKESFCKCGKRKPS